jgi:hypothetical protein
MSSRPHADRAARAGALLAVALFAATARADAPQMGTIDFLDYKNGFRDAQFDSTPAQIAGLEPLADAGELRCAKRTNEKLTLGTAKLASVEYCFFKDRLARIVVTFDTVVDTELAVEGLREAWGNPLSISRSPDPSVARRMTWTGDKVRAALETKEHVGQGGAVILMSTSYFGHLKARQDEREQRRQHSFGKDL